MSKILPMTVGLAILAVVAFARAQVPVQQERTYLIRLTASELNILGIALDELPEKLRSRIGATISTQVREQNAAFDAAATEQKK